MNVSTTVDHVPALEEYAPRIINLANIEGKGRWWAGLEPNTVTLYAPGSKRVLTVPREDVARHIRFAWDLRHGRTVEFIVVAGMRSYTFLCDRQTMDALVTWLPRKSDADVRREVRLHAFAMYLLGILFMTRFSESGGWWATAFAVLGTVGLLWQERQVYLAYGATMIAFGASQILPAGWLLSEGGTAGGLFPTIMAAIMLCWGIQQFSMLGVNAQIRAARTRDVRLARAEGSRLVQRIGVAVLAASAVLWAYGVALAAVRAIDSKIPFTQVAQIVEEASPELAVVAVIALFATSAGVVLWTSRRPAYLDAKVAAQVLIVGVIFLAWSLAVHVNVSDPMSVFGPMMTERAMVITQPLVWFSLIPAVLVFNRWFAKQMDRELEDDFD